MELYISKLTARELGRRIDDYFIYIKGEGQPQAKRPVGRPPKYPPAGPVPGKASAKTPPPARPPEPPTITGLALFIGFNSRQEFEDHEKKPRFAPALKRARLKIEAEYEKKLHLTSAAGAIFALKSLGWNDDKETINPTLKTLEIKIIETGPSLAQTEKEVAL